MRSPTISSGFAILPMEVIYEYSGSGKKLIIKSSLPTIILPA